MSHILSQQISLECQGKKWQKKIFYKTARSNPCSNNLDKKFLIRSPLLSLGNDEMKEINDDMSNNDLTQIRFHLKLRAGLDERYRAYAQLKVTSFRVFLDLPIEIIAKKFFEMLVIELGLALLEGRHLAPPAKTILPPPPSQAAHSTGGLVRGERKQGVLAF